MNDDKWTDQNFYSKFYHESKKMFETCCKIEKQIFFPDFQGDLKDLKPTDIRHTSEDCFLKKVQENIFLFQKNSDSKNNTEYTNFYNLFKKNICIKEDEFFFLEGVSQADIKEELLQFLYSMEGKIKLPTFSLSNFDAKSKKDFQKEYNTNEFVRILKSFNFSQPEDHQKFFSTFVLFLKRKFMDKNLPYRTKKVYRLKNKLKNEIKCDTQIPCEYVESLLSFIKNSIYSEVFSIFKEIYNKNPNFNITKYYKDVTALMLKPDLSLDFVNQSCSDDICFVEAKDYTIFLWEIIKNEKFSKYLEEKVTVQNRNEINLSVANKIKKDLIFQICRTVFYEESQLQEIRITLSEKYCDFKKELKYLCLIESEENKISYKTQWVKYLYNFSNKIEDDRYGLKLKLIIYIKINFIINSKSRISQDELTYLKEISEFYNKYGWQIILDD